MTALSALDPARRDDVYWAGRLTLCGSRDDLARYDAVFAAYFGDRPGSIVRRQRVQPPGAAAASPTATRRRPRRATRRRTSSCTRRGRGQQRRAAAPPRRRDADARRAGRAAPAARRAAAAGASRAARAAGGPRRPAAVDPGRTLRAWLRAGGEPARLRHHRAAARPRRVVLLVDVSGSMDAYADALLRFAHAAVAPGERAAPRSSRSAPG